MQRIIDIILKFKEYFLFSFLSVISLGLISSRDSIQIREIRSYTLVAVGFFQNALSIVPNVFELKRENEILRQLNVNLSDEVNRLREARLENIRLRQMLGLKAHETYHLVPADVISKNMHLLQNTITLNVGENDKVKPDMTIISESGLVGKIVAVSSRYSIGQLLMSKDFRVGSKVQRSRVAGIIAWEGGGFLSMKNVAKMQDVKEGDNIITSEYSKIFPQNIKIGTVARVTEKQGNLFKEIEVTPAVDFSTLEQVFVVIASPDSELISLEQKVTSKR